MGSRRYEIIDYLGEGLHGSVSLAHHINDTNIKKQLFAIKMYNAHGSYIGSCICKIGGYQCSSTQEIDLLSRITHPHIVSMIDLDVTSEGVSMVMPHATTSLKKLLKNNTKPHPHVRISYIFNVLSAFKYLVDHEILHCDLKVDNILLLPNGTLSIADFGNAVERVNCTIDYNISCMRDRKSFFVGPILTRGPEYLSCRKFLSYRLRIASLPEQVAENTYKSVLSSQCYAIGIILYQIYTWFNEDEAGLLEQCYDLARESTEIRLKHISLMVPEGSDLTSNLIAGYLEVDPSIRKSTVDLPLSEGTLHTPTFKHVKCPYKRDIYHELVNWSTLVKFSIFDLDMMMSYAFATLEYNMDYIAVDDHDERVDLTTNDRIFLSCVSSLIITKLEYNKNKEDTPNKYIRKISHLSAIKSSVIITYIYDVYKYKFGMITYERVTMYTRNALKAVNSMKYYLSNDPHPGGMEKYVCTIEESGVNDISCSAKMFAYELGTYSEGMNKSVVTKRVCIPVATGIPDFVRVQEK
jgi:serine/threonine protein kinase